MRRCHEPQVCYIPTCEHVYLGVFEYTSPCRLGMLCSLPDLEQSGTPDNWKPHVYIILHCISQVFTYRVKIINPEKRSDFVIWEMHNCKEWFTSLDVIKRKLMGEFQTQLPSSMDFQVGYFMQAILQVLAYVSS